MAIVKARLKPGNVHYINAGAGPDGRSQLRLAEENEVVELTEAQAEAWKDKFVLVDTAVPTPAPTPAPEAKK